MLPIRKAQTAGELQKNILSTYFTLRAGIVVLATTLPLLLYVVSWFDDHGLVEHSMSAFYGAHEFQMRNWFVGILWSVGAFLVLYKGFSGIEEWLLNSAGGFAVLTAVTPCNCWTQATGSANSLHSVWAISFFLCMAAVCLFCANDTISLLPTDALKKRYKRMYWTIGGLLIASPAAAVLVSYLLHHYVSRTFYIEWFGVWVFASYWFVKSTEFRITAAEKRAVRGEVKHKPGVGLVPATDAS